MIAYSFESPPGRRVPRQSERHVEPVDEEEPVYEHVAERGECGGQSRARTGDGSGETPRRRSGQEGCARLDGRMAFRFHA